MKNALAFVVLALLQCACSSSMSSTENQPCSVAPPSDYKGDMKVALAVAADLKNLATVPISADFKVEANRTVATTFQKIPESAAACAMLQQAYVCIQDSKRASEYLQFMRSTNQCSRS